MGVIVLNAMDWNTTDRSQARIACLDDEPQALTLLEKALGEYQVAPFTCSERFFIKRQYDTTVHFA